jgi:crossover junction endodeoxyribonuclease RuvC
MLTQDKQAGMVAGMVIGIDPGMKGGVAVLDHGGRFVGGMRMPSVLRGKRAMVETSAVDAFVRQYVGGDDISAIVLEAPNSMPGQGLQSTFTFGRFCGAVEGWAVGRGCAVQLVTPVVWKKHFALSRDKRASLDRARLEFGSHERWAVLANDGIAESALIALWWLQSLDKRNLLE